MQVFQYSIKTSALNQLFSTTIIILYKGIRDVIWNCKCWPSIWRPFDKTLFKDYLEIPYCTGKRLFCAKARMKSMGLGEISQTNDIIIPDPYFANDKTGSTSKPPPINCLARFKKFVFFSSLIALKRKKNMLVFLSQFCSVCIFFERSVFTFQFLNDKIHNYVFLT